MSGADNRPIGVFDSGLGGLTVFNAVRNLMPNENLIYFGDSGRTPYGTKSRETVIKYTFQDINFLMSQNVKMIVIACNTASACSLSEIKKNYSIPVVEVVEPGSLAAARATKTGCIGVIGTSATISSGVYENAVKRYLPDCVFCAKACPMFVPLVEEGWWENDISRLIAERYLKDMRSSGVDTLILGCTHYPYLYKIIGQVMGPGVTLVNSALEVARSVKEALASYGIAASSEDCGWARYFTSDSVEKFTALGSVFLGGKMENVSKIEIDKEYDGAIF